MSPKYEEKMILIAEDRTVFYKKKPFNLKNVGVTYQRLMNKMFWVSSKEIWRHI